MLWKKEHNKWLEGWEGAFHFKFSRWERRIWGKAGSRGRNDPWSYSRPILLEGGMAKATRKETWPRVLRKVRCGLERKEERSGRTRRWAHVRPSGSLQSHQLALCMQRKATRKFCLRAQRTQKDRHSMMKEGNRSLGFYYVIIQLCDVESTSLGLSFLTFKIRV